MIKKYFASLEKGSNKKNSPLAARLRDKVEEKREKKAEFPSYFTLARKRPPIERALSVLFDKYVDEEEDLEAATRRKLQDRLRYDKVYKEAASPAVEEQFSDDPRY